MPKENIYTVLCVVEGEVSPFQVEIASSHRVDGLKNRIYRATKDRFAHIDACHLRLYHVEISVHDDMAKAVKHKLTENPAALLAWKKLADVFKDDVKEETVHIIVQPPKPGK
jgi:Crinkler effector protein N-terminal domain